MKKQRSHPSTVPLHFTMMPDPLKKMLATGLAASSVLLLSTVHAGELNVSSLSGQAGSILEPIERSGPAIITSNIVAVSPQTFVSQFYQRYLKLRKANKDVLEDAVVRSSLDPEILQMLTEISQKERAGGGSILGYDVFCGCQSDVYNAVAKTASSASAEGVFEVNTLVYAGLPGLRPREPRLLRFMVRKIDGQWKIVNIIYPKNIVDGVDYSSLKANLKRIMQEI